MVVGRGNVLSVQTEGLGLRRPLDVPGPRPGLRILSESLCSPGVGGRRVPFYFTGGERTRDRH